MTLCERKGEVRASHVPPLFTLGVGVCDGRGWRSALCFPLRAETTCVYAPKWWRGVLYFRDCFNPADARTPSANMADGKAELPVVLYLDLDVVGYLGMLVTHVACIFYINM